MPYRGHPPADFVACCDGLIDSIYGVDGQTVDKGTLVADATMHARTALSRTNRTK